MNRYQEAWDFVKYKFYDGDETQETDGYTDYKKENFMLMQELVDKATPKKPNHMGEGIGNCPSCNSFVTNMDIYCPNCGQRLDWSEEKENCDEERKGRR